MLRRLSALGQLMLLFGVPGCAVHGRPPVSGGFVEVEPGVRLHYRFLGRGNEVLVVPNGSQLRELEEVARFRRVLFYDPRNRGRSDAADLDEVSAAQDVRDLEALRSALGLERIAFLGASYYGALVALYAMEHPERVDRLVMVAPLPVRSADFAGAGSPESAVLAELRRQGVDRTDPARYCREYYLSEAGNLLHDPAAGPRMDLGFCDLANEWPSRFGPWAARIFESIGDWDWSAPASRLHVPALVIQGNSDRIVSPAGARRWAGLLPEARLLMVQEAGHLVWVEQPERLLAAVETFLNGQWPTGAEDVPEDRPVSGTSGCATAEPVHRLQQDSPLERGGPGRPLSRR